MQSPPFDPQDLDQHASFVRYAASLVEPAVMDVFHQRRNGLIVNGKRHSRVTKQVTIDGVRVPVVSPLVQERHAGNVGIFEDHRDKRTTGFD